MFDWLKEFIDKILSVFPRLVIIAPNEMGVSVVLGKVRRVLNPGWWIWWPLIGEVEYREVIDQIQPLDEVSVTLQTGETILLQPALRYEIFDIVAAFYKVQDLEETLYTLTKAKLRECVAEYESFAEVDNDMPNILKSVQEHITEDADKWGVKVLSVLLVDFGLHSIYRVIGSNSGDILIDPDD